MKGENEKNMNIELSARDMDLATFPSFHFFHYATFIWG